MEEPDTTRKTGSAAPAQSGGAGGAPQRATGKRRQTGDQADGGPGRAGDTSVRGRGQGERQGFDRQRLDPQDTPPAQTRDDQNLAGDKDFELKPPAR